MMSLFSLLTQQTLLSEEESRCLCEENSIRESLQVIQRKWWGNLQRRASKLATQARRAKMIPLAIKIKIQSNKLSQAKQTYLAGLFREARYYHNYLLGRHQLVTDNYGQQQSAHLISDFDTKQTAITVRDQRVGEDVPYELQYLSSQMQQELFVRFKSNLKGLSQSKQAGNKVGALQFKRTVNSLPLVQFDTTYKLDSACKVLKLQGCPFRFKLLKHGTLKQIANASGLTKFNLLVLQQTQQCEVSSATLLKEGDNYYISVLFYLTPVLRESLYSKAIIEQSLPLKDTVMYLALATQCSNTLDAGITDSFTLTLQPLNELSLSEQSLKFNPLRDCSVLKKQLSQINALNQRLSRTQKDSQHQQKLTVKLRKGYLRLTHLKEEIAHKLIRLLRLAGRVAFQDEMIQGWHSGWYGKQVQHNVLGRVYAHLRAHAISQPLIYKQVARHVPTSQVCVCGRRVKKSLKDRIHQCTFCRIELDRDTLSSDLMNWQTQGWDLLCLKEKDLFERMSLLDHMATSGTEMPLISECCEILRRLLPLF